MPSQVSVLPLVAEGAAEPPAVSIAPLFPRIVANKKLTLLGVVVATNASAVALRWTATPITSQLQPASALYSALRPPSPPVELAALASTTLDGANLVLHPDSLACGTAYRFTLTAIDAASPPEGVSAYIDLEVRGSCSHGRWSLLVLARVWSLSLPVPRPRSLTAHNPIGRTR